MQLTRSGRFLQTGVPRIIQVAGTTSQGQTLEGENSNWDSGLGLGKPPQEPTLVGQHLARQRGILGRGKSMGIGLWCEGASLWLQGRVSEGGADTARRTGAGPWGSEQAAVRWTVLLRKELGLGHTERI